MKKRYLLPALGAGLLFGGVAALRRHLIGRLLGLSPVKYRVRVERGVPIVMDDGVTLLADHYRPKSEDPLPAVLIRTPYHRSGIFGWNTVFVAQRFAERGYHVICQDVRGRYQSEGEFEPYVHEAADGQTTLRWIAGQPWCNGRVATWGQSYVGYVQWALAAGGEETPPALSAMLLAVTQSFLARAPEEPPQLDRTLRWVLLLDALADSSLPVWERLGRLYRAEAQDQRIAPGWKHLPLATADEVIIGHPIPFYRAWGRHPDPADEYWRAIDFRDEAGDVDVPIHFVAGWYDIFLKGQLADYAAQRAAGKRPYLTIGPHTHLAPAGMADALRLGIKWFDAHLKGQRGRLRGRPVRLYVMGADQWREYEDWPPAATETPYFLATDGRLSAQSPPSTSPPDTYCYDPADPTPNVGGPLLSTHAGRRDNRALEARPDVLTYTTPPLTEPVEVIGPMRLLLFVHSDRAHTDFFGRLCDVTSDGRSRNVCDGIFRVEPGRGQRMADGSLRLEIDMWATAYRFPAGHHIRLQVSSGAHPRYARNLGGAEPAWTAMTMHPANQQIFHDWERPSALYLPQV